MNLDPEDIVAPGAADARLSIEVTKRCNSSCIHCFAAAGENSHNEIDYDIIESIIYEGADAGYRHLHITGGEPLLYGDIFKALDCALDAGYASILLNSNGFLLDRRTCQTLAKYPELTITISLEGSELLHDRFRGRGSYWKAVKGLKNALEAELDVVIFTLASKSVLPVLPKYADKLFYWFPGIKYLSLNRLVKPAYGNTFLEKEFLRPVDYLGLVRTVSLLNLIDRPTVLLNDPLINVVSRIVNIPWTPESKPLQCYGNLMIMADLSFNLAHTSNTFLGRYRPGSINRIRSSDRYQQAVSKNQQVCHTCRYVDLCQDRGLIRPVDVPTTGQEDSHFCKAVLNLVST